MSGRATPPVTGREANWATCGLLGLWARKYSQYREPPQPDKAIFPILAGLAFPGAQATSAAASKTAMIARGSKGNSWGFILFRWTGGTVEVFILPFPFLS